MASTIPFTDIHTHILPGIDDGPRNLDESTELAKRFTAAGIFRIIASSHYIPGTAWSAGAEQRLLQTENLNDHLKINEIHAQIFSGMEIAVHKKLLDRLANKQLLSLADSGYYLIEPAFSESAELLWEVLEILLLKNEKLILAHPERIPSLQGALDTLKGFVANGLQIQVTIGSVLSHFGKASTIASFKLLEGGLVHYFASDAHDLSKRPPPTFEDIVRLQELVGPETVYQMYAVNPSQLLFTNSSF